MRAAAPGRDRPGVRVFERLLGPPRGERRWCLARYDGLRAVTSRLVMKSLGLEPAGSDWMILR